jgi:hypothetical protein
MDILDQFANHWHWIHHGHSVSKISSQKGSTIQGAIEAGGLVWVVPLYCVDHQYFDSYLLGMSSQRLNIWLH